MDIDLSKPGAARQIVDMLRKRAHGGMKLAVVECMRQLSITTPVDTGRARWGWFCTVNAPSNEIPPDVPKGWKGASRGGNAYFAVLDIESRSNITFTITDTIYITNNLPYIVPLNDGHSRQAPKKFVERAAAQTGIAVENYLKTGGG